MLGPLDGVLLGLWERTCEASLARFRRDLAAGPAVNRATLRAILGRHRSTDFGRRHGFGGVLDAADLESAYARALPCSEYAAFREDIQRIARGERNVLFRGRPPLFVSTSGTTGDPKLFPATWRHQNEALRLVALRTPAARAACVPGLGYRQRTTTIMVASRPGRAVPCGIPVGNPSGGGIRRILKLAPSFWAAPPEVFTITDYPTALYLHALFALRAADLGCIEAIYCSHVLSWLALIRQRATELAADLESGGLSGALVLTPAERRALVPHLRPAPERARQVREALAGPGEGLMTRLWPGLKVVSSVVSGPFAVSAPRLRELAGPGPAFYTTCFGATEGMIGLNLWADAPEHYALALGAVHFEFLPAAALDAAHPATVPLEAVREGEAYELVITNHAGLYRYRLGDVVRIVGREGATPVFRFDHRRGNVIDLVGEKTTEAHLRAAAEALARARLGGEAGLAEYAVWPDIDRLPYRYVAYLELRVPAGAAPDAGALGAELDRLLQSEHAAYATLGRQNGRLGPPEVRLVPPGTFDALVGRQRASAAGLNANQIKVPRVLRERAQHDFLEAACRGRAPGA